MAHRWVGYAFASGAAFSWGSALVFVKLGPRLRAAPALVKAAGYALGYQLAGLVCLGLLAAIGAPCRLSGPGVVAGALWGVGKLMMIIGVSGRLGLASSQALQSCVNLLVAFVAGVLTGESVWWVQISGVAVLAAGLLALAVPRVLTPPPVGGPDAEPLTEPDPEAVDGPAEGKQPEGWLEGRMAGVLLALGSGALIGLQGLPFKWPAAGSAWQYAMSGSLGQFGVIMLVTAGPCLRWAAAAEPAELGAVVLAGLAGGGLLFVAAACNTVAIQYIGLVGSCVGQLNMAVAGVWGIVLFQELTGAKAVLLFALGVVIALGGAVMIQIKPA